MTMRGLGNALAWLVLTVGVPSAIYTTTLIPDHEVSSTLLHDAENCASCAAPGGRIPRDRPSLRITRSPSSMSRATTNWSLDLNLSPLSHPVTGPQGKQCRITTPVSAPTTMVSDV
jgi:hypothetical protein